MKKNKLVLNSIVAMTLSSVVLSSNNGVVNADANTDEVNNTPVANVDDNSSQKDNTENATNTSNVNEDENTNSDEETFNSVVTIKIDKGGVAVWDSPYAGRHNIGKYLQNNTSWKTFKRVKVNGVYWYCLGGNQWVDGQHTNLGQVNDNGSEEVYNEVVKVNVSNGGLAVWDSPYAGRHNIGKYLQNNTSWKTFKRVKVNGVYWYCLGGNQWIDGQHTDLGQVNGSEEVYNKIVKVNFSNGGLAVWDTPYAGRHNIGKYLKNKTSWKTFKRVKINGVYWYCLGGNQWIDGQHTDLGYVGKEENINDVATVKISKGGIEVWNSPYEGRHKTGKILQRETSWKVSKRVIVEGRYWYCVGGSQWIDGQHVQLKSSADARVKKAIDTAKAQVGKPYVYGGNNPGVGFDCSGLTQYAYSKAGSNIGRTTINQEHVGSNVSLNSLKPGDLIFWGKAGSSYHVAISIGGNKYIHSPKPGDRVKVDTISSSFRPSFAKRVIK